MRRFIILTIVAFGLVSVTGASSQPSAPAPTSIARAEQEAEALIAERIDEERARLAPNAPKLLPNGELATIARARSQAMADGAPFSHQDAQGNYPAIDMVKARFGPYGSIGENIMMEKRGTRGFDAKAFAKTAVDGWMASEEHRENILSPDFDRSGIGVAVKGDFAYATQVFHGSPKTSIRGRTQP
jgi:uncharacterized protein YkwD